MSGVTINIRVHVCRKRSWCLTMHVAAQSPPLTIKNFDVFIGSGMTPVSKHGSLLPNSIRSIFSGPSGSGKTNVLFNLLFDPQGLRFENIYVFSKTLYQPKYEFLKKAIPEEIGYFPYDDNSQVIQPGDAKENSIMIFDDISCEKHNNIRSYFAQGRHKNIDTFYLGQTYSNIPKQLVRDNCNFLVLFKQDDRNLRHVYNDHVTTDMSFNKLKELCSLAWRDNHGFLVIDKTRDLNKGRFRVGLDSFIKDL